MHWGKELVFVFSTYDRLGVQCWLDANFFDFKLCKSEPLEIIAHSPQNGLVLMAKNENFAKMNIEMEGDMGQMTNQDLGNRF